jgi:DNA-binding HxlR family transcriptional regulator
MRWQDIDQQVCSVARALAIVGDRWTLLILRDAFLGTRRFDDFCRQLEISRHRLSDRLGKLVEYGVLKKVPYQQKPLRHEYRLSQMGLELYPVIASLAQWGNNWCDDGNGPPVEYLHRSCGHKSRPVLSCDQCGEELNPLQVTPLIGPGIQSALLAEENAMVGVDDVLGGPLRQLPKMLRVKSA